jgi:inosose dehydratase
MDWNRSEPRNDKLFQLSLPTRRFFPNAGFYMVKVSRERFPRRQIPRREFLRSAGVGMSSAVLTQSVVAQADSESKQTAARDQLQITFGFSLYGMRSLAAPRAIATCAEIGYDAVELVATAGWPCDPSNLTAAARNELVRTLSDQEMAMPSLMENLRLLVDEKTRSNNLDRLRAAADLGHEVSPDKQPVLETVLGGRTSTWDAVKDDMATALEGWAKVGEQTKTVIAIKAHIGGALHTPGGAKWLIERVGSPWLKLNYDFSHYQLAGFELQPSLNLLLQDTAFIHVKDKTGTADAFRFLLPGDGDIDYASYWKLLEQHGYTGSVMVEVSGQIHGKPDYDSVQVARRSYANLASSLEQAGLWKPS